MQTIPQRELRNHSGEILRQAEAGKLFTITVDGRPVALLGPTPRSTWITREEAMALVRSLPPDPTLRQELAHFGGTTDDLSDPWQK